MWLNIRFNAEDSTYVFSSSTKSLSWTSRRLFYEVLKLKNGLTNLAHIRR